MSNVVRYNKKYLKIVVDKLEKEFCTMNLNICSVKGELKVLALDTELQQLIINHYKKLLEEIDG